MLQVQYIECLDRARLATNFNASAPFLKCSALPPTQTSQLQPQQSRLVTERVLELDELSVVGPKPVRVSPVMEEESESDTASEVSELPTDEEEEEAKSEKGEERVKIFNPEEKDEGEFRKEDSENVLTVNREVDSSDKEDASESTNSEDSVREIRVKADVEREDSCNDDEPVEDVLEAEEVKQGEADPSLNEAVSEVEEEDKESEKCLDSSSSSSSSTSSYSSSTSSYASSTPSPSPANAQNISSPENLSDATVPKQQLEDVNLEEDVSEVLDTIKDIVPKVQPRTQDRRSVRKASLEDSGFESFQQSSVELDQEEKLEADYRVDEDEDDVIFMPGGAMELSQRMTAEELRADAVLERAERARAVARACRQEHQQMPERKVGLVNVTSYLVMYAYFISLVAMVPLLVVK